MNIEQKLQEGIDLPTVEEKQQFQDFLESKGFIQVAIANQFYPSQGKSSLYNYKSLYCSDTTKEIKAISSRTSGATTQLIKELPLAEVNNLSDIHPVKVAYQLLESEKYKNGEITLEDVKVMSVEPGKQIKDNKLKM